MTDARNVYPRLCWACLGEITCYEDDNDLLNYGGHHTTCTGRMPRLHDMLRFQGQTGRMNSVRERDTLLHELALWQSQREQEVSE